jgi:hypothetical protein
MGTRLLLVLINRVVKIIKGLPYTHPAANLYAGKIFLFDKLSGFEEIFFIY